jgi:ankyrin repeat protein
MNSLPSRNGTCLLHIAAASNSIRCLRYLVELVKCKHLVHAQNEWDETPLHLGAAANNIAIVEILIEAGADCEARDKWNRTAYLV